MSYKRKTKDVVCRKCGEPNRVPSEGPLKYAVCLRRKPDGYPCFGSFKLAK